MIIERANSVDRDKMKLMIFCFTALTILFQYIKTERKALSNEALFSLTLEVNSA